MTTLRLYHEDTTIDCDIIQSEAIKINKAFDRIESFKADSSYTQTFVLPFTDELIKFFGPIYNVTSSNWFDHRKKVTAEIISGTTPMMRGYIQVKKHTIVEQKVDIEVLFIGEVPNLQRNIGEKKLKDIVDLPTLNYSLSSANFSSPNANTILSLCDKYGFGVTHDVSQYALQDVNYPTYIGLMTPAVKAIWLFDQIIKDAGFTYDNGYMADVLDGVYVPFISGKDLVTDQGYENVYFNLGLTSNLTGVNTDDNLTGLTEFADNGGNVASTVFTAPFYGTYTVRYWAKVERTAGTGASSIRFVLWNPTTSQQYAFSTANLVFNTNGQTIYFSESRQITLNAGDTIHLQLQEISGAGTYTLYGDTNNNQQAGTGWQLDAVSNPLLGSSVNVLMDKNAPDMRQVDFLNGIITFAKCAIVPDETTVNRIIIRPMVDYIGSGDTMDYTSKLDISQGIEIIPTTDIQKRKFTITYKADGDFASKIYTEQNGRTFGEYKITGDLLGDDVNDFATDEETLSLPFASTPATYITGSSIITASFLSESREFVLPTCRLLYSSGLATINTVDNSFTPITTTVHTLSNYAQAIPDFDTFDLNFGIETPLHSVLAQPYNTMWFRYWSKYYRELFSKESRIIEAWFNIDAYDVADLSFADKLYIENPILGNAYWRLLNVVDFDPESSKTTKLRLARIVDLGLDCDFVPYSRATATGQILFSDGVTGGLDGNQKCCERYGHVWNADDGKCYRRQSGGGKISDLASNLDQVEEERARIVYVSADYTMNQNDSVINVDSTSGPVNIYLPSARGTRNRQVTVAHHLGTGTVKVYPFGSEKVQDKTDLNVGGKGSSIILTKNENGWNV